MRDSLIAKNKRAFFDYTILEEFDAGLVLEGWEVKALRQGYGHLTDSYAVARQGELWLLNSRIDPPSYAAQHIVCEPTRSRKLLLKRKEIDKLIAKIERQGLTLIPLKLFWSQSGRLAKCQIAVAQGKKTVDKRHSEKEKQWQRDKEKILKRQKQ
jgi:SsrA-binding protein